MYGYLAWPVLGLCAWAWAQHLVIERQRFRDLYRSFGAAAPRFEDNERKQKAKQNLDECQRQYALAVIIQWICLVLSVLSLFSWEFLSHVGIPSL